MIRSLGKMFFLILLVLGVSFSMEQQAHAYVDPGSGLLVFQSLSAVVTGALFYFRRRLKQLFTRSGNRGTTSDRT